MPVHLRENWGILKDPQHVYLTNLDHPELTWWSLHPHHLFVLGMMDGRESTEAIAQQLSEGADIPIAEAAATVKEIERRFHHCLNPIPPD